MNMPGFMVICFIVDARHDDDKRRICYHQSHISVVYLRRFGDGNICPGICRIDENMCLILFSILPYGSIANNKSYNIASLIR